jgi:hypothetical protein
MPSVDVFYRAKRALFSGNVVAETTFKTADDPTKPAVVYMLASGKLDGQGLRIVVRGKVIAGAALNFTIALRQGLTTAGTLIATTGAVAIAGAGNYNFELVTELVWDGTSLRARGRMFGHVGDVAVAEVINSTALTALDPTGATDFPVCVTALFGTSNAANDARITEFVAETD